MREHESARRRMVSDARAVVTRFVFLLVTVTLCHPSFAQESTTPTTLRVGETARSLAPIKLFKDPPSGLTVGPSGKADMMLATGAQVRVVDRREVSAFFTYYEWVQVEVVGQGGVPEKWWASNGEKRGWWSPANQEHFFEVRRPPL